jgi:MYXO-CTERM domain-containing protein
MFTRSWLTCLLLLVGGAFPSLADAERIDPAIASAIRRPADLPHLRRASSAHGVPVLVRAAAGTPRRLFDALPGLSLEIIENVPVRYGDFWMVRVANLEGLRSLERAQFVLDAQLALTNAVRPLHRSNEILGTDYARGSASRTEQFTGRGITIGDIDSPVEVFHPAFFRGDAGWFTWVDVDGDGTLTPGVDGVDLDTNGSVESTEVLRVLRAVPFDVYTGDEAIGVRQAGFDPAEDWLYLDTNANDVRDTARTSDEFDDETPAFGEPLFTPDDVDGDGVVERNERLVRLGSSKFITYGIQHGERYDTVMRRGENLTSARSDYTGGALGYADTLHGSGVVGIMAADLPLVGRRNVGIAPDADYVVYSYAGDSQASAVMWVLEEGANVLVHEYVYWANIDLDGSDATSRVLDTSTASDGTVHVCPAGNIGGSARHARFGFEAGVTQEVPFQVPAGASYALVSIYAPGGSFSEMTFREPNGTEHSLDLRVDESGELGTNDGLFYGTASTSSRNVARYDLTLYVNGGGTLDPGNYVLVVTTSTDGQVHAYSMDSIDSFGRGVAFYPPFTTDDSTIAWPATADSCIAVGAVPSHVVAEGPAYAEAGNEAPGELRAYSGRGPRIDGAQQLHVVAPDNPWSVLGEGPIYPQYSPDELIAPAAAYAVFGGTSGAGPHVAGVAALLVESGLDGASVRDRITETAIDDGTGGTLPNANYGHGRLSASAALGVAETGTPPTISLSAPETVRPGARLTLTAVVSDADGGSLSVRWDDAYDGTWDTEYAESLTRSVTAPNSEGTFHVKARVRDASGRIAEASAVIAVAASAPVTPEDGEHSDDAGCGCGVHSAESNAPGWAFLGLVAAFGAFLRRRRA